jgi:hypothetical protein
MKKLIVTLAVIVLLLPCFALAQIIPALTIDLGEQSVFFVSQKAAKDLISETPFQYLDEFRAAEREAQDAGRGLWGTSSNLTGEEVKRVDGNIVLAAEDTGGQIVYVTRTGAKYHRGHCRYLRRSKIPMKLRDAVAAGYTPCKVCGPPRL